MEKILANGTKYDFVEVWKDCIKVYAYYMDKWNPLTVTFNSWEEVNEWCEKMDYDFLHPKEWKPSAPPSDYYDDTTRYYGD